MKKLIYFASIALVVFGFNGCSNNSQKTEKNTQVEKKLQGKNVVKFVMCVTRKDGMSKEAFRDYWENNHGKYFTKNAHKMNALKYIQTYTVDTPMNKYIKDSRGMREPYDGVAEVWFESMQSLQEGMSSPDGQKLGAYLLEDEKNFINHNKSTAFIAQEVEFF